MKEGSSHLHYSAEELLNALLDVLQHRGVISLEEVLRAAEAIREHRDKETAAVFMNNWAEEPAGEEPKVETPARPPKPPKDNRTKRRSPLKVPIRIRAHFPSYEFTEVAETVNVSREGVYFYSDRPYKMLGEVKIIMPYDAKADAQAIEASAKIVRIDSGPGDARRGVALHVSHLFLK